MIATSSAERVRVLARSHRGELRSLVHSAGHRDELAWKRLVVRFDPLVRGIARAHRLSPADVDDAAQATWLQVFRSLDGIREPEALPGWIATIARREALRVRAAASAHCLVADPAVFETPADNTADAQIIARDRRAVLGRAIAELPPRHRALMTLIAAQDPPDYKAISAQLGIPLGSIGPIRGRCLARLERISEVRALRD